MARISYLILISQQINLALSDTNVKSNPIQRYVRLLQIVGNEFNPTQLKTKLREWLKDHPKEYKMIDKLMDTCKVEGM